MMNGALYISFFQGQLESAMEHVVQLAVQEITKTVGSSLNSMLQETTIKDQENQRLRLRLQSRQSDGVENASVCSGSNMEETAASDETKSLIHTPSQSSEHAVYANTHWLDQKGRAVGQLKAVMEQVLKFAFCEVTKIVEDSFDDLLLELIKKEKENRSLNVRLQSAEVGGAAENHSVSPMQGETQQQPFSSAHFGAGVLQENKSTETTNVAEKQAVLSVAQDWVPILDKVFGQKWCSDLWQVKEMGSELGIGLGVGSFPECIIQDEEDSSLLESGEGDTALQQTERKAAATLGVSITGSPGCSSPVAPEGQSRHHQGDDPQLRSPSMLHRLLTLPSQGLGQLLCADSSIDVLPTPAEASPGRLEPRADPKSPTKDPSPTPAAEEGATPVASCSPVEAEQRPPAGRKIYTCRQCGKKFGRLPLLKAHQQTHAEAAATPTRCSLCGKRFTQASRLQAHLRTHAGKNT